MTRVIIRNFAGSAKIRRTTDDWSPEAREAAIKARQATAKGKTAEQHEAHAAFHREREQHHYKSMSAGSKKLYGKRTDSDHGKAAKMAAHYHAFKNHNEAAGHLRAGRQTEANISAKHAELAKSGLHHKNDQFPE